MVLLSRVIVLPGKPWNMLAMDRQSKDLWNVHYGVYIDFIRSSVLPHGNHAVEVCAANFTFAQRVIGD